MGEIHPRLARSTVLKLTGRDLSETDSIPPIITTFTHVIKQAYAGPTIDQQDLNLYDSWASGGVPVSRQISTNPTGKILRVTGILFNSGGGASSLALNDEIADGGGARKIYVTYSNGTTTQPIVLVTPLVFSQGIRVEAATISPNVNYYLTILGYYTNSELENQILP